MNDEIWIVGVYYTAARGKCCRNLAQWSTSNKKDKREISGTDHEKLNCLASYIDDVIMGFMEATCLMKA